jgi:glycolate oxidase FAD binding subunit
MRTPADESELAAIVLEGRPIHVQGSGSKRHHGPGPSGSPDPVSMKRFSRISAYEPGDLVATVQAGTRLADLQAELAKRNQWLPIDPPYADATIGGLLATNSSGPRRLGYGTLRDHLLGTRVMGVDGGITRSGGRVVKNVTGYDLHKLHVGAFGTLGILLEASFKLRPRPAISAAFVIPCASVREAHDLLLRVHDSPLRPSALEAIDGRLKHIVDGDAFALVGVDGSRPVIDRHYRELKAMAPKIGLLEGPVADPLWNALRKLPEALKDFVRVRLGARPHDLPKLLPEAPLWISVGSGLARADVEPGPEVARRIRQWHEKAAALGGYAVVESAPAGMPDRDRLPWGETGQPLHKGLKDLRDPRRLLNPGRMQT